MAKSAAFRQVAALCWRRGAAGIEIVMVTTRDSGRWIIPKGWPIKGLTDAEAAETEAMEEAGVIGIASKKPIGSYTYEKRLAKRAAVSVAVYEVAAERQLDDWLEKGQREIGWFDPATAAKRAADPQIGRIILDFARAKAAGSATAAAH